MTEANPSILIVDDELDNGANLCDILADLGYRTDFARDGFAALELVKKNRYDVALLDLRMPGMDGLELYDRMKQLRADMYAIILTAFPPRPEEHAARDQVPQILRKPLDIAELMDLIR